MTRCPLSAQWRRACGVTLVELLVTMLVMGLVAASAVGISVAVNRSSVTMQAVREDLAEARIGLDRMRREVREVNRVTDCDETDERLEVWLDLNLDGEQQPNEIITFEIRTTAQGAELVRAQGTGPGQEQVIARNLLPNSGFACFPDPPRTHLVDVQLLVDSRGLDVGVDAFRAEGQIRLRNVRQ